MLVFDRFDGDDTALAWRQRDVGAAALSLIVAVAARHYRNACAIAGQPVAAWLDEASDHSPLQEAHDVLAAAWRWEMSPPHPRLALDPPPRPVDAADWLHWLASELRGWHDDPELVVAGLAALREADAVAGAQLASALRDRYASVPWHGELPPG